MRCLFCKSENITHSSYPRKTKFNGKIFNYKKCKECGLVFIDPLPNDEDFSKMYSLEYHDHFYFENKPSEDYSWIYDLIKKYGMHGKSVVDYGCGDASLLAFLLLKGFTCIGVEYDPENVTRLRDKNKDILFLTVDEFWQENVKADVFYTGDVLEHLTDPSGFLDKGKHKLNKEGIFIARGPLENNKSLGLYSRKAISSGKSLINSDAVSEHIPYHITFSNVRNQERFFQNAGLKTLFYKISETAWPYPHKFTLRPLSFFYYLVGKMSIFISNANRKSGNRFVYVGKNNLE